MPGGGLPGVGRFTMGGKHNEPWFKSKRLFLKKQVFFLSILKNYLILGNLFEKAKKCPVEGYRAWEDSLWGVSIMNRGSKIKDFFRKSKRFFYLLRKYLKSTFKNLILFLQIVFLQTSKNNLNTT
jgi:hypothetical protein